MASFALSSAVTLTTLLLISSLSSATQVSFDNRAIKINGERKLIISGSIHYPRSTPQMWPDLIKKAKEGGLNAIETYVFWNAHEPVRRQYDFSEHLDLVRFIKTIQQEGLYAVLRIGPYVCAEWTYGGLPLWLHSIPGMRIRTDNEAFKNEMKTFTTLIVNMMKHEKLFASQGGPIILSQIENEYGNVESAYGDEGWNYVQWCAKLANSFDIGVPWIMCQQNNAPWPMLSSCNGYYCHDWKPPHNNTPKIWTENWAGWFKKWGDRNPKRTAEDIAYAVARFYQSGGSLQNYYMYHGGTNFGRSAGGPYITTSYDYDAPLDEYGNLNQPKWGHLKQLHNVLMSMEKTLTYGDRVDQDDQNQRSITIYSYKGKRSCFLANANATNDFTFDFEGNQFTVPAWSVSILPDCYTEVYNTAKVNAQTSIMVNKPNNSDDYEEPYSLKWLWKPEQDLHLNNHHTYWHNSMSANNQTILPDQKTVTNGTSDYLWLMSSFFHTQFDALWGKKNVILQVHTGGHILHAFINGRHVGTQAATNGKFEFQFEKKIILRGGINLISLMSTNVGYQNYGNFFDQTKEGVRGPIKLIARSKNGNEEIILNITPNKWLYKTGLKGEEMKLYAVDSHHRHVWYKNDRPANKGFTWYKTTFNAPIGDDPVVVDLMGLGKGTAWVNGHNIGRYWPKYLAHEDGCAITCDYRGQYNPDKCSSNCGKPSQRWYHIPRDFLKADNNLLVLFEELGGTPDLVSIQTVTVGKVCANAYEGNTLELSCQGGKTISEIKFASFGLPEGSCGSFSKNGACHAEDTLEVVKKMCLGKNKCLLQVSEKTLGYLRCQAGTYRLAVEAVC